MPKRSVLFTVLQMRVEPQQKVLCNYSPTICYNDHMTCDQSGLTVGQGGSALVTLLVSSFSSRYVLLQII